MATPGPDVAPDGQQSEVELHHLHGNLRLREIVSETPLGRKRRR